MQNTLTLSQLQQLVRKTLDERFPLPLWVSAEISEIKVNYSGHCYLELIEKGGENGVPTAQARAVIWRTAYARISGLFLAEARQPLAAGIRILAKVVVSYHDLYGFSLQITDIDPAYTLGEAERQRLQTIARLQEEGVWEMNREVELPPIIQRIAIISSAQAAGFRDFFKELEKSPYRIEWRLFDAFMQGAAAEESIIAALCAVADSSEAFDAVVVIRGGGSASDLNCFNAYRLCSYVAQFPFPVITGIGHDKDTSVADMVAHTSLKTPTAVAGWLTERMATADARLDEAARQLHTATISVMRTYELLLQQQHGELVGLASTSIMRQGLRLEHLAAQLPTATGDLLTRQHRQLEVAAELTAGHSPQRILRLGFAVVRKNGKAVTSIQDITAGDRLQTEVADGTFTTEVK